MTQKEKILLQFSEKKNINIELGISDSVIKSFESFIGGQAQKVSDNYDNVLKEIDKYNKSVDSLNNKFSSIEKGEYLKTYNEIQSKAKDLDLVPNDVPGFKEMEKRYSQTKRILQGIKKI